VTSCRPGRSQRSRKKVHAFFRQLTRERLPEGESFVAVLEVCGFNDWLIRMLREYRCHKEILIQPEERKLRKTDRRDAAALSELLWVNRDRLLQGKPVRGLRQVDIARTADQENRRLTTLRKDAGQARTRLVNKVRHILRRHNLHWEMPTKKFPSRAGLAWLKQLTLPEIDRLEMNHLLADLEQVQGRRKELEQLIAQRCGVSAEAVLLSSMPGVSYFTAVALACRVGRVERFPRAHSLANYWGLTPGCRNSGENNQRLGSITKAGSSMARWLLAQVTHKVLRRDARLREWFKRIKRRRGSTIARVAVMRKLATIIWHMLSKRLTYAECRAVATAAAGGMPEQDRGGRAGEAARLGFSALVPIPNGRGRHRAAPFGLCPWDGARVASHSRALPSAQVKGIVAATPGLAYGAEQRGGCGDHAAARLSDLSCPRAA
jgi:transposase